MKQQSTTGTIYPVLLTVYCVALVASNIFGARPWAIGPIEGTGGLWVFPLTYILSDIFSEVYGYKVSRQSCWLALACTTGVTLIAQLVMRLPTNPAYSPPTVEAMSVLFAATPRVLLGSLIAFVAGDWINDILFQALRKKWPKVFAVRAIASSFVGEIIDQVLFIVVAFIGVMPIGVMLANCWQPVLCKMAYELAIFPITVCIVRSIRKRQIAQDGNYATSM